MKHSDNPLHLDALLLYLLLISLHFEHMGKLWVRHVSMIIVIALAKCNHAPYKYYTQ